jgi:NAD(P)-dependent dehydrogenase (short-subunit alcohol dehydrogenase family)
MGGELGGRTVLVTGANTGIGRVTALELAKKGAKMVLAGRSEERTRPVVEEIRGAGGEADFLELDLGSLASVKAAAQRFLDGGKPLDVLVNNAGLAGSKGTTRDGLELTFGTNHVGPFLFTLLLLPRLREAERPRIVNVASKAHYRAPGIDFDAVRRATASTTGVPEYQVSKLANVLFTKELARGKAGPNVRSYSLHPGVIASDVWREIPWPIRSIMKLFMKSNEEGALTSIHCASSPEVEGDDGLYYDECKARRPSRLAEDPDLAKKLWSESEAMVEAFLK